MGREVRRVPANWEHPGNGPLFDGYNQRLCEWDAENVKWLGGLRSDYNGGWKPIEDEYRSMSYVDWAGERPKAEDYMPDWPQEQRTHFQMYETCTEGTPISPVMETPEVLARWLADNNASAFGGQTASYEQWLGMIGEVSTFSAVIIGGEMLSGVAAVGDKAFARHHQWPDVIE